MQNANLLGIVSSQTISFNEKVDIVCNFTADFLEDENLSTGVEIALLEFDHFPECLKEVSYNDGVFKYNGRCINYFMQELLSYPTVAANTPS